MSDAPATHPRRESALFDRAVALMPGERTSFLDSACTDAPELRARVEALLRAHDATAKQLSLGAPPESMLPELGTMRRVADATDLVGTSIGPYALRARLGEGGCGVVYLAEQEKPVRRRVALKLIKPGMDTAAAIARFEAERQALALMDHPNVARVFDAGATESGRLFFVMELVARADSRASAVGAPLAGVPLDARSPFDAGRRQAPPLQVKSAPRITDYCREHVLPLAETLQLFIAVCHAVQHAHQKGIIHRDLKPSNILVAEVEENCSRGRRPRSGLNEAGYNATPIPKIIDFGVAKTTQGRLTDATIYTVAEQLIGTPAYMSPEQADGGLDLDTRADIYALGVLLFELLTGAPPFDAQELMRAGLDGARRILREREAPRPSSRVAHLPADLDWIVGRCLEKDRARRYETANGLAMDVQRFLAHEPVVARPPSAGYRLRKYVRRHRTAVAAFSGVLAALVTGLIVALSGLHRATLARLEAERQRAAAADAARESEAVADFLVTSLASADPNRADHDLTVRALLDNSAPEVSRRFRDRPRIEARLHETIGASYLSLAAGGEAEDHLRVAAELREHELGAAHPLTLRARARLASCISQTRDAAGAEEQLRSVVATYDTMPDAPPADVVYALRILSRTCANRGALDEALAGAQRAVAHARRHLEPIHDESLWAQVNLAVTHWYRGEFAAARDAHHVVLAIPGVSAEHPARRYALGGAGLMELEIGQYRAAEEHTREINAWYSRRYGPDHPMTLQGSSFLGVALSRSGRAEMGLAIIEDVHRRQAAALGDGGTQTVLTSAFMVYPLGMLGRREEAVALARGIWQTNRTAPGGTMILCDMATDAASFEAELGRGAEALALCREVEDVLARMPPRPYTRSRERIALARALAATGDFAGAEQSLLANDAELAAFGFDVRQQRQRNAAALVSLYDAWGKTDEAETWRAKLAALPPPE